MPRKKKMRVNKRFVPIMERIGENGIALFVIGNGDLGYLKRMEKEVGSIEVSYDKDKRVGRISLKVGSSIKKHRRSKRIFDIL